MPVTTKTQPRKPQNDRRQYPTGQPRLYSIVLQTKHGDKYELNMPEIVEFIENSIDELWIEGPEGYEEFLSLLEEYAYEAKREDFLEKERVKALRFIRILRMFLPLFYTDVEKREAFLRGVGLVDAG